MYLFLTHNLQLTIYNSQFTMIAVIQRVSWANVVINNAIKGEIKQGFLVLLGIAQTDNINTQEKINWLAKKIIGLRIFSDENDKMNLSLEDIKGDILLISQFTLLASTKKGNRPSYLEAARPEIAIPIYEDFILNLEQNLNKTIQTGIFGADMKVSLLNDGPVTIIIDTENKE